MVVVQWFVKGKDGKFRSAGTNSLKMKPTPRSDLHQHILKTYVSGTERRGVLCGG